MPKLVGDVDHLGALGAARRRHRTARCPPGDLADPGTMRPCSWGQLIQPSITSWRNRGATSDASAPASTSSSWATAAAAGRPPVRHRHPARRRARCRPRSRVRARSPGGGRRAQVLGTGASSPWVTRVEVRPWPGVRRRWRKRGVQPPEEGRKASPTGWWTAWATPPGRAGRAPACAGRPPEADPLTARRSSPATRGAAV